MTPIYDAIVVGAGPAGLTAGTYLGRFRRSCLVLEDGVSRARWIPTSHNVPGFAAGIGGIDLLKTLRKQALQFGAQVHAGQVTKIERADDRFAVTTAAELFYSRYLVLATGVEDHLPEIPGAPEAVTRSLLRVCPICDAFEAIDKRIAVIGDGALAQREAAFLKSYSDRITLLYIGDPENAPSSTELEAQGIEFIPTVLTNLHIAQDRISLSEKSGERRNFDVVYLALGVTTRNRLAKVLGAACDELGALTVNSHQETSVSRLYAAGDVVRGLNQVIVAAAEGALAATDIHNKLRATAPR